jgi:hypothetical protein
MNDITVNAYILYGLIGFLGLLQIATLGGVLRLGFVVGRQQGEISGIHSRIDDLRDSLISRIDGLAARIDRVEEQVANLREQVAENRGLLLALHERVGLIMRHRHDDITGAVILTPTVPDPVVD